MTKFIFLFSAIFLMYACSTQANKHIDSSEKSENHTPILLPNVKQILVVRAENENAITAKMQLFRLNEKTLKWDFQSSEFPVTLGRTGLAWGKGVHPDVWNVGTLKKEGDGKAPQGFFPIMELFGYAEEGQLSFSPQMPYRQADAKMICVDDVKSKHYNRILDKFNNVEKDWDSHEDMLRKDNLYELGAVIDYNVSKKEVGAGSCVFLHIWRAADKATAGCTAGESAKMRQIFALLDKGNNPTLVQLTEENYRKAKVEFVLP
jgi:L,D-peptidoglycan transpeptidase YkuD (ErfK/YbiS/YcfS/YnhG family)